MGPEGGGSGSGYVLDVRGDGPVGTDFEGREDPPLVVGLALLVVRGDDAWIRVGEPVRKLCMVLRTHLLLLVMVWLDGMWWDAVSDRKG